MKLILQVFLSIFSALILALALPNEIYLLGSPYYTLFALVPFYYAISKCTSFKRSAFLTFLFTGFTHLFSSFWLANFKDFAALTLGASSLGTAGIGFGFGLLFYLPYCLKKNSLYENSLSQKFLDSPTFRIIYFSAVYTCYEWIKSIGFLGYPWATLPAAIFRWPVLMQLAAITGRYGITFLLCLVNGILGELYILYTNNNYKQEKNRNFSIAVVFRFTACLFACAIVFGLYEYNKTITPQKTLQTVIIQHNYDNWDMGNDNETILDLEELTEEQIKLMREEEVTPQLIVWSEGTVNRRFPNGESHYKKFPAERPLSKFIKEMNTPLVAGGAFTKDKVNKIYFNAAIMYDKNGQYRGYYGKNHLVPFAEAIPGMEIPAIKDFMSKVIGISSGWTPGDQYVFFDIPCTDYPARRLPATKYIDLSESYSTQLAKETKTPTVRIATPICYDDAFPDIMGKLWKYGAELFVNLTNDSWSLTKSAEYQHFTVAAYSAIEYRTSMIRATNSGYSVVLDPRGKILTDLPLFERTGTYFEVPVYQRTTTIYSRFGNWLPEIFMILIICYGVFIYCKQNDKKFVKKNSLKKIL